MNACKIKRNLATEIFSFKSKFQVLLGSGLQFKMGFNDVLQDSFSFGQLTLILGSLGIILIFIGHENCLLGVWIPSKIELE